MRLEEMKLLEALRKNELKDYIRGTKGYMVVPPDNMMSIPSEGQGNFFVYLVEYGVYQAYKDYPDKDIGNRIVDTLIDLLNSKDLYDVYCSYVVTSIILRNNYDNLMNIDASKFENLLSKLRKFICDNEELLKSSQTFNNGEIDLYSSFERHDNTCFNKSGRRILWTEEESENNSIMKIIKERVKTVNEQLKKYLPLGSVVLMKDATKKLWLQDML